MTDQPFKASNGLWITPRHDHVFWHSGQIRSKVTAALREFFRHERDQQLGRARWPENPNYVIYRDESEDDEDGRCVLILDERSGASWWAWEKGRHWGSPTPIHRAAADWFFTEGPGKKPARPWEEAQSGEVWRLTVEGREDNTLVTEAPDGKIYFRAIKDITSPLSAGITAGRKLVNADGSLADDQG